MWLFWPTEVPANSQHQAPAMRVETPPEDIGPSSQGHSQFESLTRGALRHPGAQLVAMSGRPEAGD